MTFLTIITLVITSIPFFVYSIYLIGAMTSRSNPPKSLGYSPDVSIVIPAYNEESGIESRIDNLVEVYPKEKMEIIVSNDGSTDSTEKMALDSIKKHSIKGKVITNPRSGVNAAINRGTKETSNPIVVIAGADGLFDKNTIPYLVSVLLSSDYIGAVSGDLVPVAKGESMFSRCEVAYRSIYGRICTWESKVHSTYCFNGPVVAFKKNATSSLNTRRGADDASMALSVIRNGFKCKYVPAAKFYEYVPDKFNEQRRQKIRRATRLLEATFFNRDVLSRKYGSFGLFLFPLRLLMFFVVPALFLASILLWSFLLWNFDPLYGIGFFGAIVLVLLSGSFRSNVVSSFIIYQFYLFMGLFNMLRDVHTWEPTERVKI